MSFLIEIREYVGYLAGLLATLSFLPQVLKTLKHRRTQDISLGMYALFCSGVFLWMIYAILISSVPLLVSNSATLILAGTVLFLKVRNG
jgi:MtN3 and saliva related transmembrane protein